MNLYSFLAVIFLVLKLVSSHEDESRSWLKREIKNPLKLFGKCVTDSECEYNQYCDHNGINPIGACKIGFEDRQACMLDRHCRSKHCHLFKCAPRERVKDGPCNEADHSQCISEQYCSHIDGKKYKCKNRKCHGFCGKDAHCLTNVCSLLRCKRPSSGCKD